MCDRHLNWRRDALISRSLFGLHFECDLRDQVQRYIYYLGLWEPDLTSFIKNRLKSGSIFIDVGANVGYFSLLASKVVGSAGQVIAIEASPKICRKLERNIHLNGANNIRVINKAVADRIGTIKLFAGPDSNLGQTTSIPRNELEVEGTVPAAPLAELVGVKWLKAASIIKIDIEGAEVPVLEEIANNINLLSSNVDICVEIWPEGYSKNERISSVIERFQNSGFKIYEITNDYHPRNYFDYRSNESRVVLAKLPLKRTTDLLITRAL
ncbi:MAG: hypothetical protein BroJett029_12200 [Alphaproteobacteria bacterium]|nr:MAG: hypothetical protein BroJett029_12200 [Alphaproteobacteria bacterium]